jgi:hypothetical protein
MSKTKKTGEAFRKALQVRTPKPFTLSKKQRRIFEAIRSCLSVNLLSPSERKKLHPYDEPYPHPVTGHCFVATHAAYRLIGKGHGLEPHYCNLDGGGTHWWLWNQFSGEYLDPTFEQASQPFPYNNGRLNTGYIKREKRRSGELVRRVLQHLK